MGAHPENSVESGMSAGSSACCGPILSNVTLNVSSTGAGRPNVIQELGWNMVSTRIVISSLWSRCQFSRTVSKKNVRICSEGSAGCVFRIDSTLIHSSAVPVLFMSSFRHSTEFIAKEIQSTSISFAHKDGVSSIKVRQRWHTCDVVRVVRRACGYKNMSPLIVNICNSASSSRVWI